MEIARGSTNLTALLTVAGDDGRSPSGLTLGPSGQLIGATGGGGDAEGGTTFRLTPVPAPAVVGVTPQDLSGDAAAPSRRPILSQLAVSYNEPVRPAADAFTLGLVNNFGSNANDGTGNPSGVCSECGGAVNAGGRETA